MKLALSAEDIKKYEKEYPEDSKKSFVDQDAAKNPSHFDSHAKTYDPSGDIFAYDEKHEWVNFKLDRHKGFSPDEKARYEWFCAGFLHYYDTVVRHDAIDHTMYFVWETKKVTIYLHPAPLTTPHSISTALLQTDPPKPSGPPPPPLK